jgi:hypothetical protein
MVSRRRFLLDCLALCAAPAIVRADTLMRVVPRETILLQGFVGTYGGEFFMDRADYMALDKFIRAKYLLEFPEYATTPVVAAKLPTRVLLFSDVLSTLVKGDPK